MRHILRLTLPLLIAVIIALPASASDYVDMDICIGKQIVARILCKTPNDVNYVARVRDNIYLFSVFYANKDARFFVGVYDNMIRVQGKDFQTVTRSIPYHFDETAKCGIIDYSVPDCETKDRIICCSEKTLEEKLDETFWDRPIPDLLEEDLRNALEADNATQQEAPPQNAPKQ